MQLSVISYPGQLPHETETVNALLNEGLEVFHVRKPDFTEQDLMNYLQQIDPVHYAKLALHQHHGVAAKLGITRLHYPEKQRQETPKETLEAQTAQGCILSTSIHIMEDATSLPACFSYAFYGPVFASISKQGYGPKTGAVVHALPQAQRSGKLIALGGITPEKLGRVSDLGYDGAALLGAIWDDPLQALEIWRQCIINV